MLFNIKNLRINSFCRNVVSKVIRCNRVHRFRISYCQQYIVNYCCCLQQKVNKLMVLLEMYFQRLFVVIGYIDSEYDSVNNI